MIDMVTQLRDGDMVLTVNSRQGMALNVPQRIHRRLAHRQMPDAMWRVHDRRVGELAGDHGGVRGPVGPDDFVDSFAGSFRIQADYNLARGVYVPE